jgi:transposase InsO family protein
MRLHGNAALSWSGRRRLAERVVVEGWTLTAAAEAAGVSVRCARKWVGRYRLEGERGLLDRSSRPRRVANRTPEERVRLIVGLRRLRFTAAEIAELLGMALSTVSGILARQGMGRLGRLGLEQPRRYERSRPGELVHIDVKRLGRIEGGAGKRAFGSERRPRYNPTRIDLEGKRRRYVGYEYVHVCVDDYSRLAYAEVLPDEKTRTAIGFLERAVAFYRRRGIRVERLLTDNGSAYVSAPHALACRKLGIRHSRTRPYRPQTNGKAERFTRTCLPAGPMGRSTARARSGRRPLTAGSGTTTIDDDTQLSAASRPSAEPTCSGLTPRRSARRAALSDPGRARNISGHWVARNSTRRQSLR